MEIFACQILDAYSSTIVLPRIPTKDLTAADVDKLTQDTRAKMLKVLEDFAADSASRSLASESRKSS